MIKNELETKNIFLQKINELIPEAKITQIKSDAQNKINKIDLVLKLKFGNFEKILVCEVKSKGEPRYIFQAVSKIKSLSKLVENSVPVIIAPYIAQKGQDICKEFQVGYVDLSGNIWLSIDSITIEKQGKKYLERDYRFAKNIFAKKSSRVIKRLLLDYKKIWTLEELSKKTNSAISYIHRVVKTLEKAGYLRHKIREGVQLNRPEGLLLDWAKQYNVFRDNEVKGFYTFKTETSELLEQLKRVAQENNLEYALTLFTGTQLIVPYVRSTDFYVYFNKSDVDLWINKLELKRAEAGPNFYIINPYDEHIFWDSQSINSIEVVSNIQLFLDLYNFPKRGEEQAIILKNEKIKFE